MEKKHLDISRKFIFTVILLVIFISQVINVSAAEWTTASLNNDLRAYYSFDEGTGTTVTDKSVYKNSGVGVSATMWASGGSCILDNCYSTDGNKYINISNAAQLNPSNITLSFWLYMDAYVPDGGIFSKGGFSKRQYDSYSNADSITFNVWTNTAHCDGPTITDAALGGTGTWRHIVYIYNSSGASVYVNGTLNGTSSCAAGVMNTTTDVLQIGAVDGGNQARIRMDELGIWGRALTSAEIAALYNGGTGVTAPNLALLNQSAGGEILNFTVAGNITRYLLLSTSTGVITSASMNLTGLILDNPIEKINQSVSSHNGEMYGTIMVAQSFYLPEGGYLTQINLSLDRVNDPVGNMVLGIREIDDTTHKPIGNDLVNSSKDATIPAIGDHWENFTFTPYYLEPMKNYSFVFRVPEGDSSNKINYRYTQTDEYSGEDLIDNPPTWTVEPWDMKFQLFISGINFTSLYIGNTSFGSLGVAANETLGTTTTKIDLKAILNSYLIPSYIVAGNYQIPFIFSSLNTGLIRYFNFILSSTGFTENSQSYNSTTYETATEGYSLNLTYDTNYYSSVSANLVYNGTSYAGTKTGTGSNILFSRSLTIPASSIGTKSFFWNVSMTNTTETEYFASITKTQTVSPILFGLCNSSLNVPFINFTFKDEATGDYMNASINLLTSTYGLTSSVTKSYLFTNLSVNNPNYAFCFSPADKSMLAIFDTLQYSFTGYPQRHYYFNGALTNSTTNTILYLLGSSVGIYSSIQTATNVGNPISGVTITVERQFNGVWTQVEQGVTDSSGLSTFWVNPNYDHRYTASKTGYATSTVTLRPTQSTYTIVMTNAGSGNATYLSPIEGISYTRTPSSGIIPRGTTLFTYNITSSKGNMVNCRFDLTYYNGTVINSASSACTTNAYLTISHFVKSGDVLYGKYYVDMGSGYQLLESDGNWRAIASNGSSAGTILSFLTLLGDRSAWGVDMSGNNSCHRMIYNGDPTCENYLTQGACEADATCFWGGSDDSRRFEFTIIVMVFFSIAILGAATNIGFQYDLYNPGYFIWILPFILLILSLAGQVSVGGSEWTNPQGLLYIEGATFLPFFDNYIITIYAFILTGIITLRSGRTGS